MPSIQAVDSQEITQRRLSADLTASGITAAPARPSTDQPVAIQVDNLSKSFRTDVDPSVTLKERFLSRRSAKYGSFDALTGINFSVLRGESLGILGHNGSGKSTLLKIMAGTLAPTSGRVKVAGRLSALLELGAGFHPDLTGRENVYLNGSILGFGQDQIDQIFEEIVDFAELEEFIDLQVKYYSSGMTARLGFAVATNLDPDTLLVDEVLAVGDEAFQLKCFERVHRLRQLKRTMVIVSHGPERIRELCDRALVLERGKPLFIGDVGEAIDIYRTALHKTDPDKTHEQPQLADAPQADANQSVRLIEATIDTGITHPDGQAPVFGPGDSVGVTIRLEADEAIQLRVRLVLRSSSGLVLMNRSTSDTLGRAVACDPGINELSFVMKDLPLLDGTYLLSALLETPDGSVVHHRIGKIAEIRIVGPGAGYGQVAIDLRSVDVPAVHQARTGAGAQSRSA